MNRIDSDTRANRAPAASNPDGWPPLAAVVHDRGFDLDGLLGAVCRELRAGGVRLGGVLHVIMGDTGEPRDCCTMLQIVDLATGSRYEIWQDLGAEAEGCRLDERGLAAAVPAVMQAIEAGVDLLVINRFGKAESHGGGMISAIAAAIEAGIPVLTAVRKPYDVAWQQFHGGLAAELPPDPAAVLAWARSALGAVAARPAALTR